MNRNRILIGVAVAIVIGLIASHFVYNQLQRASAVKPVPVGHIVVAAQPMALGTALQPQQLRMIDWPQSDPLPGSFSSIQQCVGRALITPIAKNEPILEEKLAPKEAGAGLPAAIPEGMRGVSVRVDDVVGVSGFAVPGTMVDVLVTGQPPTSAGDSVTRTILEDVRVLAAGQQVEQDKQGKPVTVSVVTLLVTPEQADKLTLASTQGRIHLALRNTIDTKVTNPPPIWETSLLLGGTAPPHMGGGASTSKPRRRAEPAKPAEPPPYVIQVIRGDKMQNQSFPSH